jgi:protein-tyrosine phosphatase
VYVDLHLHLLPGVDDGCRTIEESLAMARTLVALGVSVAAPSPHNRPEYADAATCATRLVELTDRLAAERIDLRLEPNAENFFLDEQLLATAATPAGRRVGHAGKYLLVEAPYAAVLPSLNDMVFRLKLKGVTPLIAHPERCVEFEKPGRAQALVEAGALLQMDVGALLGRYGKTAQKLAREFLKQGLYAVVATDLHSPVGAHDWVANALNELERLGGKGTCKRLFAENPAAVLAGKVPTT